LHGRLPAFDDFERKEAVTKLYRLAGVRYVWPMSRSMKTRTIILKKPSGGALEDFAR
jgi:hypothetical protein